MYGNLAAPPHPGNNPKLISGNANKVSSVVQMMSHNKASSNPPPKHFPET